MAEVEARYNEYGEVLPDEDELYEPARIDIPSSPLSDTVMNEAVMNYRRSKPARKLSFMEAASLAGTPWTPPLNKRQRDKAVKEDAR